MHKKMFILLVLSVITFATAFIGMNVAQLPDYVLVFPINTSALMLTAVVFTFGFLLFGYPLPIITLISGLHVGWLHASGTPITSIAAMTACTLLAAFASAYMGTSLLEDLSEHGNFKQSLKLSLSVLAVALIIAVVTDFTVVT